MNRADLTPRWRKAGLIVAKFVSFQVGIQLVNAVPGLILFRFLSKPEYAFFGIAVQIWGAFGNFSDMGLTMVISATGGKIWHNFKRFGELISTALHYRFRLAGWVCVLLVAWFFYLLHENHCSTRYAVMLFFLFAAGIFPALQNAILASVPRLIGHTTFLQVAELKSSFVRLGIVVAACLVGHVNAAVAIAASSIAFLVQFSFLRKWVWSRLEKTSIPNAEDAASMKRVMIQNLPNTLFALIQGQLAVGLITYFGKSADKLADLQALGNMGKLFAFFSIIVFNLVTPRFARCQSRPQQRRIFLGMSALTLAGSIVLILISARFPEPFLWIMGPNYSNLRRELPIVIAAACFTNLCTVMWSMNSSKAWLGGAWMLIPLTIVTQVILGSTLNLGSVAGLLWFQLWSALPVLILQIWLAWNGMWRKLPASMNNGNKEIPVQ